MKLRGALGSCTPPLGSNRRHRLRAARRSAHHRKGGGLQDPGAGAGVFDWHGLTPNVLLETSNLEFIKGMVKKGEGVSFLVKLAIAKEIDERRIAVIPIRDQDLFFQVHIAYLEAGDLSPAAQAFLQIFEEERERFSERERARTETL